MKHMTMGELYRFREKLRDGHEPMFIENTNLKELVAEQDTIIGNLLKLNTNIQTELSQEMYENKSRKDYIRSFIKTFKVRA